MDAYTNIEIEFCLYIIHSSIDFGYQYLNMFMGL